MSSLLMSGTLSRAYANKKETVPQLIAAVQKSTADQITVAKLSELGRRKDKRAVFLFIKTLKSHKLPLARAVSAKALADFSATEVVDALRSATKDRDKLVKRSAHKSLAAIEARLEVRDNPMTQVAEVKDQNENAEYLVKVKSAIDDSPGQVKHKVRRERAHALKAIVRQELSNDSTMTLTMKKGDQLETYALDVAIAQLKREANGALVEVSCDLRLSISDKRGKMLSILTGGAKVSVPKAKFRKQYEAQMQKEALENAVKNVHQDLSTYLSQNPI